MIHLPFSFNVEKGKNNIIALGNNDNKEILIECITLDAEDGVTAKLFAVSADDLSGGRDVTSFAQSGYLGETLFATFTAVSRPEMANGTLIKITKSDELVDEEDGITIPSGMFLVVQVDAPMQGNVVGNITWTVRGANEVF